MARWLVATGMLLVALGACAGEPPSSLRPLPLSAEAERSCRCIPDTFECPPPLRCLGEHCERVRNIGDVCMDDAACALGRCKADGHCEAPAGLDETCNVDTGPWCDRGLALSCADDARCRSSPIGDPDDVEEEIQPSARRDRPDGPGQK